MSLKQEPGSNPESKYHMGPTWPWQEKIEPAQLRDSATGAEGEVRDFFGRGGISDSGPVTYAPDAMRSFLPRLGEAKERLRSGAPHSP